MRLTSRSFDEGQTILREFAFAVVDPRSHVALCPNRNPQLQWNDVPAGTRSFAIICHDYDVPSSGDDVPQLSISGDPTGNAIRKALAGHVIAEATLTGTYSLNPPLIDRR